MKIKLSNHFTYKKLLHFTLPSIVMLVITSIYGVIDGFFVSNFVGKTPFAAVNLIMPFLLIFSTIGLMFGTGGSALISKTMGEGKHQKAKQLFSMFVYVSVICGIILTIFGVIFIRPIAELLGAKGTILDDCVRYGRIFLLALPANILQYEFQCYFATAGKPKLGLAVIVLAGVTNIILDALFVAVFPFGLVGAAVATFVSLCVGGIVPLIYFGRQNTSLLRLTKMKFDRKALLKACGNGFSELLSNISASLVSILYNVQLMKYVGEDGVAAYGVLMYVNLIFLAVFIGYSVGVSPVVGYHYGAQNHSELKGLLKKGLIIIGISSIIMFLVGQFLAKPLSVMFVGFDEGLLELTMRGFAIYSFSFLFSGFAIYGSSFFTSLNDGLTSAAISFLRTLVFQIAAALILPLIFGVDGIWISIVAAECMAAVVTALILVVKRKNKFA